MTNEPSKIFCFSLAGKEYGIDAQAAVEVLKAGIVRSVPQSEKFVIGIINLRGRIIPVIDIGIMRGEKNVAVHEKIVAIRTANFEAGLLADEINGIILLGENANIKGKTEIALDKRRITLLDLRSIFMETERKEAI